MEGKGLAILGSLFGGHELGRKRNKERMPTGQRHIRDREQTSTGMEKVG